MTETFNPAHLINEMRHDVENRDVKKAALVLAHLPKVDEDSQLRILSELKEGEPDFALPLLASVIVENPVMELVFPEIRQWMAALAANSTEDLINAIYDSRGRLRQVLVGTAAELALPELEAVLMAVLNQERDPQSLCAIVEALGEVGGDDSVEAVAEFLYVTDDDLFASAARSLARIGSPAAVEQLRRRIGIHPHLDEMIVGILWEVQTPESLKALNSVLAAGHAAVRAAARQALRLTGPKAIPVLLENLSGTDDDVTIHSLELLGDIGDDSAYRGIRHLLQRQPKEPNVRFAAFEALGKLPMQGKGFALAAGLEDPVESVRTAAAAAIEQNFDAALYAGVKNMVSGSGKTAEEAARALADARAEKMVTGLVAEVPLFREAFVKDLSVRAHPETAGFFHALFRSRGQEALADEIAGGFKLKEKTGRRVFAVDDSLMILKIYKGVLHQLGFEAVTFDSPAEAIASALQEKPAAVLTDLNMPEITGVELTKRLREVYDSAALPIIMVTTQRTGEDFTEALRLGADKVIYKPFTSAEIGAALSSVGVS